MSLKFDQSWIASYTKALSPGAWWEKLQGEDRKNAEAWILATRGLFKPDAVKG